MSKHTHILLIFSLLFLVSCDQIGEWFAHEIPYDGDVNQGELVVTAEIRAGEPVCVFVNESNFFLDPAANEYDSVSEYVSYKDGDIRLDTVVWMSQLRRGWIENANVVMKINDGESVVLVGHWQRDTIYNNTCRVVDRYSYQSNVCPQAGDKVQLFVNAPGYKDVATVTQNIPMKPHVEVVSVDTVRSKNHLFTRATIKLPAQDWPAGTMLRFKALLSVSHESYNYNRDDPNQKEFRSFWYYSYEYLYSDDARFAACEPVNQALSQGHYGGDPRYGMYLPTSHEEMTVDFLLPYDVPSYIEGAYLDDNQDTTVYYFRKTSIDSLVLTVSSVTRDEYLYVSSMVRAGYFTLNVRNIWSASGPDDDKYDIVGTIQNAFDELGTLEGIQLYGNMHGAFGHVTASSPQRIVLIKDSEIIH